MSTKSSKGIGAKLSLLARLRILPRFIKDPGVSILKKGSILVAVAYIIIPLDAVHDYIPVLGWLDDLGVVGAVSTWLFYELGKYGEKGGEATLEEGK